MIKRYTLPEMGAIWTEENKFRKWLDVEIAACQANAEAGNIPSGVVDVIRRPSYVHARDWAPGPAMPRSLPETAS